MQNGEKYITFSTYIHVPIPPTLPLVHPPCPSAPAPPFPPTSSFFTQPRKPFSHSWSHLLFTSLVWELHICLSTCKTYQSTFHLIISMITAPVEFRVLACPVREFPARSPNPQNWFLSSPGFTHLSKCRDNWAIIYPVFKPWTSKASLIPLLSLQHPNHYRYL